MLQDIPRTFYGLCVCNDLIDSGSWLCIPVLGTHPGCECVRRQRILRNVSIVIDWFCGKNGVLSQTTKLLGALIPKLFLDLLC